MVSEVELRDLIGKARKRGAVIRIREDADDCIAAVSIGRLAGGYQRLDQSGWLPVIQAAEMLREFISMDEGTHTLQWIDDRWHLNDRPIHAGCGMEVQWPDGTWQAVRIESEDCGRKLFAHFKYHGLDLCVRVAAPADAGRPLRWHKE